MSTTPQTEPTRPSTALLAISWLAVTLPTLWGLSYTVRNALKLFTHQPAPTHAPVNPGPVSPPTR